MRRRLARVCASLLVAVFLGAPGPAAPQPRSADDAERERAFIEALRREDPADADRYVALSEARAQAIAELRRAEGQYQAAGPELRSAFAAPLRRAQRKFAEAGIAILDFFDTRERRAVTRYQEAVTRYQEEIQRINKTIEDRQRSRAELQKLLD